MASVTSLDADMRKLRFDRYTPQAANETRHWIEATLNESLPSGDLLDSLKDGVALCKLANLVLPPPGIKFKASSMPFTQRENIAHFLTACEMAPLNMPSHDRFLTVDLYDNKDPAQVLQGLQAFSRAANAVNPNRFPTVIGPKKGVPLTPRRGETAGLSSYEQSDSANRARGISNASQGSDFGAARSPRGGRTMSPNVTGGSGVSRSTTNASGVSSWTKKSDEGYTSPAWNIHQYGYMGGASQGNQGISFGARRQIIAPGVDVPSREEKERVRRERELEDERTRIEAERRRQAEIQAEEDNARLEEERRWEEETRRAREGERAQVEAEKRRWEEQERKWKLEEEERRGNEQSSSELRGQLLNEHKSEQSQVSRTTEPSSESDRIKELERQLEEAKQRELRYLEDRERKSTPAPSTPQQTLNKPAVTSNDEFEAGDERAFLRKQHDNMQEKPVQTSLPPRPLPTPAKPATNTALPETPPTVKEDKAIYSSPTTPGSNRTDRFLASNPAPAKTKPQQHFASEMGFTSSNEKAEEDKRRVESQQKTKAGGWASKSLLEREMERERERQKEWEEQQIRKGRLTGPRAMR